MEDIVSKYGSRSEYLQARRPPDLIREEFMGPSFHNYVSDEEQLCALYESLLPMDEELLSYHKPLPVPHTSWSDAIYMFFVPMEGKIVYDVNDKTVKRRIASLSKAPDGLVKRGSRRSDDDHKEFRDSYSSSKTHQKLDSIRSAKETVRPTRRAAGIRTTHRNRRSLPKSQAHLFGNPLPLDSTYKTANRKSSDKSKSEGKWKPPPAPVPRPTAVFFGDAVPIRKFDSSFGSSYWPADDGVDRGYSEKQDTLSFV